VDTLGISGTRAANWLTWDEAIWAEQVKLRNPALVTLAYGTNETSDEHQPIERYERDLERVLIRLKRAAPGASCLLIGPADVAKKVRGVWTKRRRLGPVIEVQRRLALAHGCGFWDARRSMGDGGIARWHRAAPRMAAADHIHLTRRGYVKIAIALGDALLRAYDAKR
jgi:lysophospholipase L1-like esterase